MLGRGLAPNRAVIAGLVGSRAMQTAASGPCLRAHGLRGAGGGGRRRWGCTRRSTGGFRHGRGRKCVVEVAGEVEITADSTLVRGRACASPVQCQCSAPGPPPVIRLLSRRNHTRRARLERQPLRRPRRRPLRRAFTLDAARRAPQHSIIRFLGGLASARSLALITLAVSPPGTYYTVHGGAWDESQPHQHVGEERRHVWYKYNE